METDLSSLELHFMAKELSALAGFRAEKIFQWGKDDFIFKLFSKEGKRSLRIRIPGLVYLTSREFQGPSSPPGFCSFLRKYLTNVPISKVEQRGFERILLIHFDSNKFGKMILVAELFKPGNLVLCKVEGDKLVVMQPLMRQEYKDRSVEAKKEYVFPPAQADLNELDANEIAERLLSSDKLPVKFVAIDFGLGGFYAEEAFARAGIDKNIKKEELNERDAQRLAASIKSLLKEPYPFTIGNSAFPLKVSKRAPESVFGSFSEAIDSFMELHASEENVVEEKEDKGKVILDAQRKRIRQLEAEAVEAQKIGEYIYERYADFQKLLSTIQNMRVEKKSLKDIEKELKKNKYFKSMDEKEKTITFEF